MTQITNVCSGRQRNNLCDFKPVFVKDRQPLCGKRIRGDVYSASAAREETQAPECQQIMASSPKPPRSEPEYRSTTDCRRPPDIVASPSRGRPSNRPSRPAGRTQEWTATPAQLGSCKGGQCSPTYPRRRALKASTRQARRRKRFGTFQRPFRPVPRRLTRGRTKQQVVGNYPSKARGRPRNREIQRA